MQLHPSISSHRGLAIMAVAFAGLAFTGCTTTAPKNEATATQQRNEINTGTDATLTRLYESARDSRALVQKAAGVLVFPNVISGAFVVGAEHGRGVLRVKGKNAGYYSTSAGSIGFQAGAQSKAIVLLFMTPEALEKFRNSSGWTVGVDATVAIATIGANGSIDTNTMKSPVVGFVLTNAGLMAGVSLEGAKIQKIQL